MWGERPAEPAHWRDRASTTSRRGLLAAGGIGLASAAGCLGLLGSDDSASDDPASDDSASAGPWTQKRGGPQNRSHAPERRPGSDLANEFHWRHPETEAAAEFQSTLRYSTVTTDGERLYCSVNGTVLRRDSDDVEVDEVVALDPDSRDVLWRANAGGYAGAGATVPPSVSDGTVLACENGPVALDASDGSELWSLDGPPSWIPPAIADGTAYVSSNDGLHAIDLADGADAWPETPDGSMSRSAPAIGDGAVYVSNQEELVAFDRDSGEELWRTPNDAFESVTIAPGEPGLLGAPVIGSGSVFTAGSKRMLDDRDHGGLLAVDRADGSVRWRFDFEAAFDRSIPREPEVQDGRSIEEFEPTGAYGTPALAGDTLFAFGYVVGTPKLLAVGASSGELRWDADLEGFTNHVLVCGDAVYALVEGTVATFDRNDGSPLDEATADDLSPHANLGVVTPTEDRLLIPSVAGIFGFGS